MPAGFGASVAVTAWRFLLDMVPPYASLAERAIGVARAAREIGGPFLVGKRGDGEADPGHKNQPYDPFNPHTHLVLVGEPAGYAGPRCMTGTLRPVHQCHANLAAAFARVKLAPGSTDPTGWSVTAYRAEVVLAAGADDRFCYPRTLFEAVDAEHPADSKALLAYVTLTKRPTRLHGEQELGHTLATGLVEKHGVAVLLIQHVPARVACGTDPHLPPYWRDRAGSSRWAGLAPMSPRWSATDCGHRHGSGSTPYSPRRVSRHERRGERGVGRDRPPPSHPSARRRLGDRQARDRA